VERLSRARILQALEMLGRHLPAANAPVQIAIMGGAALVLLYGARETTKDVDAFILGSSGRIVCDAAKLVAAELGLPADWLNEGAKGYLHGLALGDCVIHSAKIEVYAVATEQLLAMKLSAWRDDLDVADARLLLAKLAGDRQSIWQSLERYLVPGRELKARYAFEDLWEAHGSS
jgi:hypothetical protein